MNTETLDGRFTLKGPFRCTGVGTLMCAEDKDRARTAIRLIPDLAQGKEAVAAALRLPLHPVLPRPQGLGAFNGSAWVAIDFPEGELLTHRMPLTPKSLLAMGSRISGALAALHQNGVVHGELSGESVLVVPAAGTGVAKNGCSRSFPTWSRSSRPNGRAVTTRPRLQGGPIWMRWRRLEPRRSSPGRWWIQPRSQRSFRWPRSRRLTPRPNFCRRCVSPRFPTSLPRLYSRGPQKRRLHAAAIAAGVLLLVIGGLVVKALFAGSGEVEKADATGKNGASRKVAGGSEESDVVQLQPVEAKAPPVVKPASVAKGGAGSKSAPVTKSAPVAKPEPGVKTESTARVAPVAKAEPVARPEPAAKTASAPKAAASGKSELKTPKLADEPIQAAPAPAPAKANATAIATPRSTHPDEPADPPSEPTPAAPKPTVVAKATAAPASTSRSAKVHKSEEPPRRPASRLDDGD